VPSMAEFLVEVSPAMNSSCVKGVRILTPSRRALESAVFLFLDCATIRLHVSPSTTTLHFRSTRDQYGNFLPIFATVHLYRILQLAVFIFCPFTQTTIRSAGVWIQDILPSIRTLHSRSSRYQRGNCSPILAAVRSYRILQLAVFDCCPFSLPSSASAMRGSKIFCHLSRH
jgi:hypothetical protein